MAGFEIRSEATTAGTEWDGTRHSAWSGWDAVTAPVDHVINTSQGMIKVEWHSQSGSENNYEIIYADEVDITPTNVGIKLPRTIKVRTYARSPKGSSAGRGWSKIKVTGEFVKYR